MSAPRPRLLGHVLPRRHVIDGARLVVLHDTERLTHHRVSERTWAVLGGMDGTRDAEGLLALASSLGLRVSRAELDELMVELEQAGLILNTEPPASAPPSDGVPDAASDTSLPVRQLPDFLLSCDGRGTCCRFYPSIAFTPLDAARARAHAPEVLDGGRDESRVFLPMTGHDRSLMAVTLVDGRCAYLAAESDRCGIHHAAGAQQKPLGCRTYPARFVSDGSALRVGPWLECGCVFQSGVAQEAAGEPLLDAAIAERGGLDPAYHVESLPEEIWVSSRSRVPRREVAVWSDALRATAIDDGLGALLTLSRSLELDGLSEAAQRRAWAERSAIDPAVFAPALLALKPHLDRFAGETFRSAKDLVRTTATALASAAELATAMGDELVARPARHAAAERFYLRALLFGHQLVHPKSARPMSVVAFDRAFRLFLARALSVVSELCELDDPAFAWPIALVEASFRGYGLSVYAADLAIEPG